MSVKIDWLIVGLGNPGKKYVNTRHNIGWMVAEAFAEKHKAKFLPSLIYQHTTISIYNTKAMICLPTTYMNASGEAVSKLSMKFSIPAENIVVIVDEYNFPLGKIHLKSGGSDGGHNGVFSVIEALESREFLRLRCGIDRNFSAGGLIDYVLSNFTSDDSAVLKQMIKNAVTSIDRLLEIGVSRAMSDINSEILWKEKLKV
jgi:PTH1 family peptidyl-tRNA hydrolase